MTTINELSKIYYKFKNEVVQSAIRDEYTKGDLYTYEWNEIIYEFFIKEGINRKMEIETNYKIQEKFRPEWYQKYVEKFNKPSEYLVDFCWWKEDEEKKEIWIELALELEWMPVSPHLYLDVDFEKLLDLKARMKIGIGGCRYRRGGLKTKEVDDLMQLISDTISKLKWKLPEEAYLFIFLDNYTRYDPGMRAFTVDIDGKYNQIDSIKYSDLL